MSRALINQYRKNYYRALQVGKCCNYSLKINLSDHTIAEKINAHRFANYKEHIVDLLQWVGTVSVKTMKIVGEMKR